MLIAGAGKHAKDLLCLLEESNSNPSFVFFQDIYPNHSDLMYGTFKVLKSLEQAETYFLENNTFVIGTGGSSNRQIIHDKLVSVGGKVQTIISETAVIGNHEVDLREGLNVMAYVFISNSVLVGRGTLLNTRSSIHHDVEIGAFCDISPGATLLGGVKVGDFTQIGANATILPNVKVGNHCVIGAGAVVTKDLKDHQVVKGIPAK